MAQTRGLNGNQVFGWRRPYRQGLLEHQNGGNATLLPVSAVGEVEASETGRPRGAPHAPAGLIPIELPKGRLRLTGCVDLEILRVVLEKLQR